MADEYASSIFDEFGYNQYSYFIGKFHAAYLCFRKSTILLKHYKSLFLSLKSKEGINIFNHIVYFFIKIVYHHKSGTIP